MTADDAKIVQLTRERPGSFQKQHRVVAGSDLGVEHFEVATSRGKPASHGGVQESSAI